MEKPQQLEFDFEPKKTDDYYYQYAIKALQEQIKKLQRRLNLETHTKENLIDKFIDSHPQEKEREVARYVYSLAYNDNEFLDKCPSEYLTQKEKDEWFGNAYEEHLESMNPWEQYSGYQHCVEWALNKIKQQEGGKHAN